MHSIFNSYIFVTGKKDSDQIFGSATKKFTVYYPQV